MTPRPDPVDRPSRNEEREFPCGECGQMVTAEEPHDYEDCKRHLLAKAMEDGPLGPDTPGFRHYLHPQESEGR